MGGGGGGSGWWLGDSLGRWWLVFILTGKYRMVGYLVGVEWLKL